jgi:hypothetical protein
MIKNVVIIILFCRKYNCFIYTKYMPNRRISLQTLLEPYRSEISLQMHFFSLYVSQFLNNIQ